MLLNVYKKLIFIFWEKEYNKAKLCIIFTASISRERQIIFRFRGDEYLLIGMISITWGRYVCYFVLALLFGIFNSLVGVAVQVIFVSRTPEAMVGRIGGIFNAMACSSVPAGSFVLAGLSMMLSIKELYMFMGFLTIAIFLILGRWKGVAELEE